MKKLYPKPFTLYPFSKGFTLAEILVVIGVMSIAGVIITQIFLSSVKGGNKAQILGAMKQNGQAALDLMDKTIKNSDNVTCVTKDTIQVEKNNVYTRYKFTSAPVDGSANGKFTQDNPTYTVASGVDDTNCIVSQVAPIYNVTDTNTQTGVSISLPASGSIFTRNQQSGFTDVVSIEFNVGPGVATLPSIASSIDPIPFSTSIVLR